MSTRELLSDYLPPEWSKQQLDAYRAEVLRKAADDIEQGKVRFHTETMEQLRGPLEGIVYAQTVIVGALRRMAEEGEDA